MKSILVNPFYIAMVFIMTSCTITFDQVMTYGTADDVIDNTPTTEVSTEATVPFYP
jgi:hypothetical protein